MSIKHSHIVSSFNAIKVDRVTGKKAPCAASESGIITAEAGDIIRFPQLQGDDFSVLNALMLHAVTGDLKVALNENTEHPAFVPAGASLGISSMAIYSLTILEPCSFRYEGLAM